MVTFLRIVLKTIASVMLLLLLALLVATLIGIKIDLGIMKPGITTAVETVLDREVHIAGPVELEVSLWPAISISDLHIANVAGARQPDFLRAGHVQLRLGIVPLLRGDLTIVDIIAEQVTLNLETDVSGSPNWAFGAGEVEPVPADDTDDGSTGDSIITFAGLDHLSLQDIAVNYHDTELNRTVAFELESMVGAAATGEPIKLNFEGHLQDNTYDLELLGSSIQDLLDTQEPWAFELKGDVVGRDMIARGELLLQGDEPQVKLAFGMRDVDVGAILQALGLVEGMQASMGDAGFKLDIKGDSLNEILQQSSMAFKLRGGSWNVKVPNSDASFDINELHGDILVERGNAITMKLDGSVDTVPVALFITGAPLVEYVKDQKEIPMTIDAQLLDSRIQFYGSVKLPVSVRDISLGLRVSSERIDRFNDLLRLELPPLGPVELASALHVTERGYDLSMLNVSVGDSHLDGTLILDTSGSKPRLEVTLLSELIQLDDFDTTRGKVGTGGEDAEAEVVVQQEKPDEVPTEQDKDTLNLLSYDVLNAFDADIQVAAQDVRSGEDRLGSAQLRIELQDARLAVVPLTINVPGGTFQLHADYQPSLADIILNVQADVEEFDIGVLVRRARPESDMGGKFTLDAELHAQAPDLPSVMAYASGNIDFALVPENFSSGVIDLWAVNLLSAIMTKSTEQDESQINCVVVRFGLEDGLMRENAIYMDTSSMRVAGESDINFKTRQLAVTMAPEAKRAEFFSMALPIQVKGTFDDFGLKLSGARTAGQVISFITSPLHVPIRRAVEEDIPADGIEACKAAWAMTPAERKPEQQPAASMPDRTKR
jgi:uncharacterized protein involved in outer membrane biogenesis